MILLISTILQGVLLSGGVPFNYNVCVKDCTSHCKNLLFKIEKEILCLQSCHHNCHKSKFSAMLNDGQKNICLKGFDP